MPKDYQISQYDEPINVDGWLELPDGSRVGIERAHMEEDTGKTTHVGGGGRIHEAGHSLVDYNRAGVPLVEIVSRPDIRSAAQARAYVDELRSILVATGASDGRMEEGSLRVDANVSVRPVGLERVRDAVRGEEPELAPLARAGDRLRGRTPDRAHRVRRARRPGDPPLRRGRRHDPLPALQGGGERLPLLPRARPHAARARRRPCRRRPAEGVGPMPAERRRRLSELVATGDGLATREDGSTDQVVTVVDLGLDELVHGAVARRSRSTARPRPGGERGRGQPGSARAARPRRLRHPLKMESSGQLSATQSKEVLAALMTSGGDPAQIASRLGYEQLDATALEQMVDEVIAANPGEWQRYREGDDKVVQFLLGQVMRISKGRANGKLVAAAFAARRQG